MSKKVINSPASKKPYFICLLLVTAGAWWGWNSATFANWKDKLLQYVDNRDIVTLEARFSPEQIVAANRSELLGSDKKTLKNSTLKYYPYLLLDVKYLDQGKTREGILLWGLNDGEMVINTEKWETTHGFKDCLESCANRNDFKILQALARHQGTINIEELQKELHIERELLAAWTEEAKQKHLIVQKGNLLQLHFENPRLLVIPQTKIKHPLVTKPPGDGQKASRSYSRNQIVAITQAAFGKEYTIRNEQEIFLPVYSLEVLNPDGSIQISDWNALTGQRMTLFYY